MNEKVINNMSALVEEQLRNDCWTMEEAIAFVTGVQQAMESIGDTETADEVYAYGCGLGSRE